MQRASAPALRTESQALTQALHRPVISRDFWVTSNTALARLHASRLATVCAIRGACPAGGCCIAMACDYRVMTETGHIGLNEVALGIPVPRYWMALMARVVGHAAASRLCQRAALLSPGEALGVGLVDEVVSPHKLLSTAEAVMDHMLKLGDVGRVVRWRCPCVVGGLGAGVVVAV